MGSERIQRASEQIWKFELLPWTQSLFTCSVAPTPSALQWNRARELCRGSAYCSASLRAADYDHHKCQAVDMQFCCAIGIVYCNFRVICEKLARPNTIKYTSGYALVWYGYFGINFLWHWTFLFLLTQAWSQGCGSYMTAFDTQRNVVCRCWS